MIRNPVCRRFDGKVAIVTGGAAGIGRATVAELLGEGARVAISDLADVGSRLHDDLGASPEQLLVLQGDMADEAFCHQTVARTQSTFGRVDHLVNNAFSFIAKGEDAQTEDWMKSFVTGPLGFARMIQAVAPAMRQAGGGSVVNVGSISGAIAQRARWTYNTAKGAVNQLTRCAALDLAVDKIRVNSVSPGWIWSQQVLAAAEADGGGRAKWEPVWGQYHMLRRCGEVHECARAILFLLSDDASFITGTDLPVDGGYQSMGPEGIGQMDIVVGR